MQDLTGFLVICYRYQPPNISSVVMMPHMLESTSPKSANTITHLSLIVIAAITLLSCLVINTALLTTTKACKCGFAPFTVGAQLSTTTFWTYLYMRWNMRTRTMIDDPSTTRIPEMITHSVELSRSSKNRTGSSVYRACWLYYTLAYTHIKTPFQHIKWIYSTN